jgi:peptidoglycan hydrolase-like protein with peptidoglycan-binding domain
MIGRRTLTCALTRARGMAVAVAVALALAPVWGTAAPPKGDADIQWAQDILRDQGYDIGGRPDGEMNDKTRAALSQYQRKAGLAVTGSLDRATTEHMLATVKAAPTMGNLASPSARRAAEAARAAPPPPAPKAAPKTSVQGLGGGDQALTGVTFPGSVGAVPAGSAAAPTPDTAPRTAVEATPDTAAPGPALAESGRFEVPVWVHAALYGALGMLVAFGAWAWWSSGRRAVRPAPGRPRTEPRFIDPDPLSGDRLRLRRSR